MKAVTWIKQAVAGLAATAALSAGAQTTLFTDNMESLDGTAALVGNDWQFQKIYYTDADCTAFGGVYAYTQVDPQPARNTNYYNVTDPGGVWDDYSDQSVEAGNDNVIAGGVSLNVLQNAYSSYGNNGGAVDDCHRVRTFKDHDAEYLDSGTYRIQAKTAFTRYGEATSNPAAVTTGVYMLVLDRDNLTNADANYGVLSETFRPVPVTRADGVLSVDETFSVDVGNATNIRVRAGFYTQVSGSAGGGALWDDLVVSYTSTAEDEEIAFRQSRNLRTGLTEVPTLPLGGLIGLVALVGWMGSRRNK